MFAPLAKLKKSPHNARKVPHGEAAIEALAASIQHKGLIQNLVVEPEVKANGEPTGYYFVRNRRAVRRVGPSGEAPASLGRCQSKAVAGVSRRPEARREGYVCVSTCNAMWSTYHQNKKIENIL